MAGRIPESFIQDLLARTDIVEVIGARLELKRAGKEYKARSPFTNEKTPSFFVSPSKQMYFCFSSGKSGNAIGFLMEHERLGYVEAIEALAESLGLEVPREGGGSRPVLTGALDALAAAERFFREQLRAHPPAIDYLRHRGVDGTTAKAFGLGYAPDRWDALASFLGDPRHGVAAGLLIEREGASGRPYDRFRNRIMFPIRDARGRAIAFGGRALGDDPAKYLNSPETPLFHKGRTLFGLYEAKRAQRQALTQLVVVEGYMDVVMLHQHGITEAVATLGTATTREHLQLLFRASPKVVFCFDGDRAGRAAAWRALEQTLPELHEGRDVRFLFLPEGEDPDSLVQKEGTEAFRQRLAAAEPLSQFLIDSLRRQADLSSREGRAQFAAAFRPHLDRLPDGPLKESLARDVAQLARLKAEDLRPAGPPMPMIRRRVRIAPATEGPGKLVDTALRALLEQPSLAATARDVGRLLDCPAPGVHRLIAAIEFFDAQPEARAAQLLEAWRGTEAGEALSALLATPRELGAEAVEAEFRDSLERLHRLANRARADALIALSHERPLTAAETRELGALLKTR